MANAWAGEGGTWGGRRGRGAVGEEEVEAVARFAVLKVVAYEAFFAQQKYSATWPAAIPDPVKGWRAGYVLFLERLCRRLTQ